MFARWNRMAKQFARIGKDITIAVKTSGTDPAQQPGTAPRDPERARAQHAEGQDRGRDQARLGRDAANFEVILYEGYAPHGVAVLVETRDRQPDTHRRERAQPVRQERRQPRDDRQRRVPVQAHGRVPA